MSFYFGFFLILGHMTPDSRMINLFYLLST